MFPTYEGQLEAVNNVMQRGGSADEVIQAIYNYKSLFSYKCSDTFCPMRKSGINGSGRPGFPSSDELELHRVRDHANHGLYTTSYTITGSPRFECSCGHNDYLSDEEVDIDWWQRDFVCASRVRHLTEVRSHGMISEERA